VVMVPQEIPTAPGSNGGGVAGHPGSGVGGTRGLRGATAQVPGQDGLPHPQGNSSAGSGGGGGYGIIDPRARQLWEGPLPWCLCLQFGPLAGRFYYARSRRVGSPHAFSRSHPRTTVASRIVLPAHAVCGSSANARPYSLGFV
jgi:hypothetical protein